MRQDEIEATKLPTGRAPMTPIISPLATAPTTRPRVASGANAPRGDQDLHRDRAEADGAGAGEKGRPRCRQGRGRERDRAEPDADEHKPPVLGEVGERHDEKKSEPVADLRHGHDETGGLRGEPEQLGDRLDQRLRVIDAGGKETAGGREQQDCRRRDLRLARDGWRLVHAIHR